MMTNKLRRKFSLFAILSVFTFLILILLTINIVNFSLVSSDADHITKRIKDNGGFFNQEPAPVPEEDNSSTASGAIIKYATSDNKGPNQGSYSPEMRDSLRYFTVSYDQNNVASILVFKINSFSEEEAIEIADTLKEKSIGWTGRIYRFRSWTNEDKTARLVTVIDQDRELRPCYNTLYASLIGGGAGLVITVITIYFVSKYLVRPIEEADNKQRRFIANASIALRTPISIMAFDNETLMKENGVKDPNKSLDQQLKKMLDLANDLNAFSLIAESRSIFETINLSNVSKEIINRYIGGFTSNHKSITTNIADDIMYEGDVGMIQKMLSEIIENCLKYSDSAVEINIFKDEDRIVMVFKNDCKGLPDGSLDRVFDRFYRLNFKDHSSYEGSGIGLAIVKDIVEKHKGRVIARGENGNFVLKVEL